MTGRKKDTARRVSSESGVVTAVAEVVVGLEVVEVVDWESSA